MKKIMLVAAAALMIVGLAGCGKMSKMAASWNGYDKICVDGVSYLQFTSGASVQYDKTGRIVTCER
jgi:ABC-type Zn uptake system ZnuABC Zn-binding protein ZnuA